MQTIAFIMCVNNELLYNESCFYINNLIVPQDISVDIIAVRDADSMCSAYNAAMKSSDAKYKVYLHQDVFIRNKNFIIDLISRFEANPDVGMIGMLGGDNMPKTGVAYKAWNYGLVHEVDPDMAYFICGKEDLKEEDIIVEAIDGLLIATQYDIPWREDLFKNFDFYDVSQSFEMRKAGYKILVPNQKEPWVIHKCSYLKLSHYDESRKIAIKEYKDFFYANDGDEYADNVEWDQLSEKLYLVAKEYIESDALKDWNGIKAIVDEYRKSKLKNTKLSKLEIVCDIIFERGYAYVPTLFKDVDNVEDLFDILAKLELYLIRLELFTIEELFDYDISKLIKEKCISVNTMCKLVMVNCVNKSDVFAKLYKMSGEQAYKHLSEKMKNHGNTCVYLKTT